MEEFLFIGAGVSLVLALIAIFPMLTTKRRWLAAIFFLVSIILFSDGVYRVETRNRTTPDNLESKIRQWLDAFNITSGKVPDDQAYFNYQITVPNLPPLTTSPPLTIAREKAHPNYLTLATQISLSKDDQEIYDKFSAEQQTEFRMVLGAELAKSKIVTVPGFSKGFGLTILNRTPITSELNEATFFEKVNEVDFGFIIANNTIELLLTKLKAKPPSPTPNTEASPH
jgi:hypothetical protein